MNRTDSAPVYIFVVVSIAAIVGLLFYADGVSDLGVTGGGSGHSAEPHTGAGAHPEPGPAALSSSLAARQRRGEARAIEAHELARAEVSVTKAVAELRALYGFAGSLNQAEARALIERRRTATAAIVARLANADVAGIQAIGEAYRTAESGKEKLMLIEALSSNPDSEATLMMAELYESEETFSYRRALIEGVGDSPADNAGEVAATFASEASDARERISALKALPMEEASVPALVARVEADSDVNVRISAVTRLSKIGGNAAFSALNTVVAGADEAVRLRAAAVQAIARGYPAQALATLSPLAQDPQARVRAAVVRALEQIKTDEAVNILRVMARDDTDASVRSHAAQALSRVTL